MEQISLSPLQIIIVIALFQARSVLLQALASQVGSDGRIMVEKDDAVPVLRLQMTHVDSLMDPVSLHKPEIRLRRAVENSLRRAEVFARQAKSTYSRAFSQPTFGRFAVDDLAAPVFTSTTVGAYLVNLSIGTPPQSFNGVLDTGSDLVWRQSAPCVQCYQQSDPLFDPSISSTYETLPCTTSACFALPLPFCTTSLVCMYNYTYGDGSTSVGILSSDTLTIGGSSVDAFVFGAGIYNYGLISEVGTDGIVGMGGGPLSLVSQMSSIIESKFSYCLVSYDDAPSKTSSLLLGPGAVLTGAPIVSTPFITRSDFPTFYYLGLQGISLGGVLLNIPPGTFDLQVDGSGGLIIDSGTTVTTLVDEAYTPLRNAYSVAIKLPEVNGSAVGLDLCFDNSQNTTVDIPLLTFHFDGADVELPLENIFLDIQGFGLCLAFVGLPPNSGFNINIYGNIQQQNFQILYDKGPADQLSFKPTTCGTL